jgi:ArsR family transcriptional regulator, arsenate/arsenite/antimonite-responsive transcriptional repressor
MRDSSTGETLRVDDLTGDGELPLEEAVGLLIAVADPNRLALLRALTSGTQCVCDLQRQVPLPGNRLSYHLKVLREAGLIAGVKRGRWIDYSLVEGALDRLRSAVPVVPGADAAKGSCCGTVRCAS